MLDFNLAVLPQAFFTLAVFVDFVPPIEMVGFILFMAGPLSDLHSTYLFSGSGM